MLRSFILILSRSTGLPFAGQPGSSLHSKESSQGTGCNVTAVTPVLNIIDIQVFKLLLYISILLLGCSLIICKTQVWLDGDNLELKYPTVNFDYGTR